MGYTPSKGFAEPWGQVIRAGLGYRKSWRGRVVLDRFEDVGAVLDRMYIGSLLVFGQRLRLCHIG
jgi:hypothetical protein